LLTLRTLFRNGMIKIESFLICWISKSWLYIMHLPIISIPLRLSES
jgi:hypothetical protein